MTSGLRAAVSGGIAVTLRTARWMGDDIAEASSALDLPGVQEAEFSLRLRRDAGASARALADLLADAMDAAPAAA